MTAPLIVAAVVVVFAGAAYGLAGFGLVMVSVPPLLLLFSPQTAVTVGILLSMLTGWMILPGAWRETRIGTVLALLPGAMLGVGLGVALLGILDADSVKLLTSVVVTAFAAVMIRGWTPTGLDSRFAPGAAGAVSGALGAMTGMNGPPVVLLFVARGYEVQAFRASLVTYFLLVNVVAISARAWAGETGWDDVRTALTLLPAAAIGTTIGRRLAHRVPIVAFRRLVLLMVLVAGLVGIASALRSMAASMA